MQDSIGILQNIGSRLVRWGNGVPGVLKPPKSKKKTNPEKIKKKHAYSTESTEANINSKKKHAYSTESTESSESISIRKKKPLFHKDSIHQYENQNMMTLLMFELIQSVPQRCTDA